jgi:hypothetical protein
MVFFFGNGPFGWPITKKLWKPLLRQVEITIFNKVTKTHINVFIFTLTFTWLHGIK